MNQEHTIVKVQCKGKVHSEGECCCLLSFSLLTTMQHTQLCRTQYYNILYYRAFNKHAKYILGTLAVLLGARLDIEYTFEMMNCNSRFS